MFTIKDVILSVWYALQAYRFGKQTDRLCRGALGVKDVFNILGYRRDESKDYDVMGQYDSPDDVEEWRWHKFVSVYVTPKIKLPPYYDFTGVVNLNTWKTIRNMLNVSAVYISYSDTFSEAVSESEHSQLLF